MSYYRAETTHILINNLRSDRLYTLRVAAYTKFNGMGSFSKPITAMLQHSPNGMICVHIMLVL